MTRTWLVTAAAVLAVFVAGSGLAMHEGNPEFEIKTDTKTIERGKVMFKEKCAYCHDPAGVKQLDGPPLKGILKNPTLPVSKKPATPENVASQMRHPYKGMPMFTFTQEEFTYILSYLNTL